VEVGGVRGFRVGTDAAWRVPLGSEGDGEFPATTVDVGGFWLDALEVSNAAFADFVAATGHVTESEAFGWSFVFCGGPRACQLSAEGEGAVESAVAGSPWWLKVEEASWRRPEGGWSAFSASGDVMRDGREDHPVVHVSFGDALAFCRWAGGRLPSEAEWEVAARGGSGQDGSEKDDPLRLPWEERGQGGGGVAHGWRMNVWQGSFPGENTGEDGCVWTCAGGSHPQQNALGVFHMLGNVWEWVADELGPREGGVGRAKTGQEASRRLAKGGSFLCHDSHCRRARVTARIAKSADSAASNQGFRCAYDAQ